MKTSLSKVYVVLAVLLLSGFAWAGFTGWEYGTEKQRVIPAAQRNGPNGVRGFHFWHVGYGGYRGGK